MKRNWPADRDRIWLSVPAILCAVVLVLGAQSVDISWIELLEHRSESISQTSSAVSGINVEILGLLSDQSASRSDSTRSLEEFYARRAYPGAPPIIPHELNDPADYGGRACLRCHSRDRYVPRIGAYTPITPHPELLSCRSCHVLQGTDTLFSESDWERPSRPTRSGGVLPTSPPAIPHTLQLRQNCPVCHTGPGSVPELLTKHPERKSCQQCHVASSDLDEWGRG